MAAMALAIIVRRSMETSRFRKLVCLFVGRGGAAGSPFPEAVINGVACASVGGIPAPVSIKTWERGPAYGVIRRIAHASPGLR